MIDEDDMKFLFWALVIIGGLVGAALVGLVWLLVAWLT